MVDPNHLSILIQSCRIKVLSLLLLLCHIELLLHLHQLLERHALEITLVLSVDVHDGLLLSRVCLVGHYRVWLCLGLSIRIVIHLV